MNNIFDIINPGIFSVLTGVDRRNNYLLLHQIYTYFYDANFQSQIYKDEIIDHLVGFLRKNNVKIKDETEDNTYSQKEYREYILNKIRNFKDTGWFYEDVDNNFQTLLGIYDSSVALIAALKEVAQLDSTSVEQSGYVYSIYSNLKQLKFSNENTIAILEQASANASKLRQSMLGLNSNIKRFIERLMNNTKLTPKEVLSILFDEYQHKVIVKSFNNLKTKDNPEIYANFIVSTLNTLIEDETKFSYLVANYKDVKKIENISDARSKEIEEEIRKLIFDVIRTFDGINMEIDALDTQNTKFITSASARLQYLVNENIDLEGRINQILKKVEIFGDEFEFNDEINISSFGQVDEFSIYLPRKNRVLTEDENEPLIEVTEAEIIAAKLSNPYFSEFNKKAIFDFATKLLGNKFEFNINELTIKENRLVLKLLLMKIYQFDEKSTYKIIEGSKKIMLDGFELSEFVVQRKEDDNEL